MVRLSSLQKKKVLITGGSSGIGLATARAFQGQGAIPILVSRDEGRLKKASRELASEVYTYSADISDLGDVNSLYPKMKADHEKIDVIINSAGVVHPGILNDLTHEQIDSMIDVDLKGTIHFTKTMLPLISSPGYIVNISSMAGFLGVYGYSAYSAAKFGVWGFSQSLRMELEPEGIGVAVVFPPDTDTPQLELENRTKPDELKAISGTIEPIQPEKVASSIVKAVKGGEFMVFPDGASRSAYHASRLAGPLVRGWMDKQVKRSRSKE